MFRMDEPENSALPFESKHKKKRLGMTKPLLNFRSKSGAIAYG